MRILHVSHSALPRIGGVEIYLDGIVRAQLARHDVAVLAPDERGGGPPRVDPSDEAHRGVRRYTVPGTSAMRTFRDTWASAANEDAARAAMEEFRPDVVHVHHLLHQAVGLVSQARAFGAGVVMTLHDYVLECANGGQRWHPELGLCDRLDAGRCAQCTVARTGPALALLRLAGAERRDASESPSQIRGERPSARAWLRPAIGRVLRESSRLLSLADRARIESRWAAMRSACADADLLLSPSRFVAEEIVRFGVDPGRVRVVPRGLRASARPSRGGLPETAERFGYVGSLVPHKGVHVLVEAFGRTPTSATLVIHGDPNADPVYAARLRALCRDDRVRLAGPIPNRDVAKWLSSLDCLVSPSVWWENHPTTVVEAFAAGVPVVGSAIGGQAELLSSGGAISVPPDDVRALGDALTRLCTEPGLLHRLAEGIPAVPSEAEHLGALEEAYLEVRDLAVRRGRRGR